MYLIHPKLKIFPFRFFDNCGDGPDTPTCSPRGTYPSGNSGGMVYPSSLVPSHDGRTLLMHASASRHLHGDRSAWSDGKESSLLTYGIRKDGFVALTPSTSDVVRLGVAADCTGRGGFLKRRVWTCCSQVGLRERQFLPRPTPGA